MLTSLVSLLPASAQPYAKTITAAVVAALTVLVTSLPSAPSWLAILLAVLSAPAVFAVPNLDPKGEAQDESTQPPYMGKHADEYDGQGARISNPDHGA